MRFLFFLIFVIGAVSARSFIAPEATITSSAEAEASVNGQGTTFRETTGTGASASASASASSSATFSSTPSQQTLVSTPIQASASASTQVSAQADYSNVDFKRMTKAEMEAFQRANPGCQLVVRKVTPSPCAIRTPCATLVRRLAPCSPPVIYAPCQRIPVPCQTKTVRKSIRASSSARSSVSEVQPTITVTRTDAPCAPSQTTVMRKVIDPVNVQASASANAEVKVEETPTPVVAC